MKTKKEPVYLYNDQYFYTAWELAVWIWAKDTGRQIRRCEDTYVQQYGSFYFEYVPTFILQNKTIAIIDPEETEEYIRNFWKSKELQQNICSIELWGSEEMKPALEYVESTYTSDFIPLFKIGIPFPYPTFVKHGDMNIIRYFHKSIYTASKVGYLTPVEAWQDKKLILRTALNRLRYVYNCRPSTIVQGLNIAKIAPKVSVFKPAMAEQLIKTHLRKYMTIVDPFSGFSGRLLGASNCNKNYIGFDINKEHVEESNRIIDYKKLGNCAVIEQDLITGPIRPCNMQTALFTCPPYAEKEYWTVQRSEVVKSCDDWIDLCLQKFPGCGTYLFVVDVTEKYTKYVVDSILNKSHFGSNNELIIKIVKD